MKLNILYSKWTYLGLGLYGLSLTSPAIATLTSSSSMPQLCFKLGEAKSKYSSESNLNSEILKTAECIFPEGQLVPELVLEDLTLQEENKLTSVFRSEFDQRTQLDSFVSELSEVAQAPILKHMPYFTPEQIDKMNRTIHEELDALSTPSSSEQEGNYQPTRHDVIYDTLYKRIGKNIVQLAAQITADETGKMIAYRALNPNSYRFIAAGFPTKPMAVKGKSAQKGLIAGLIPVDAKWSKIAGTPEEAHSTELNKKLLETNSDFQMVYYSRQIEGVIQFAVYKEVKVDGKTELREQWKSDAELTASPNEWKKYELIGKKVLDSTGNWSYRPITADVDLAFVGKDKKSLGEGTEAVYYHEKKGYVTQTENRILNKYNQHAKKIGNVQDLVNHGSQANDPSDAELDGKVKIAIPHGGSLSKVSGQQEALYFTKSGIGSQFSIEGSNLKGMGSLVIPVERTQRPLPTSKSTEMEPSILEVH